MKSLIASVLFLIITMSCKNNEDTVAYAGEEEAAPAAKSVMMVQIPSKDADGNSKNQDITAPKIIKEGTLRFETSDLDSTYGLIISAARKNQGQIQSDVSGKDFESVFRHVTIRIPNAHFDTFVAEVSKGVSYFDRKEISARDVTEEYIDVEARLRAKKVLETRYLQLLGKAVKVSEILEIEKELAAVREEIEAKEGQLRYLENHVSMSTVAIEFYKKTALESGVTASYGSKMWNALKSGFNGISAFFIGLLYIWPFIIILVALTFWLRKKLKKKTI